MLIMTGMVSKILFFILSFSILSIGWLWNQAIKIQEIKNKILYSRFKFKYAVALNQVADWHSNT